MQAAAIAIAGGGVVAAAAPTKVLLVTPVGSRLGEELKRELEISGFGVVPVHAPAGQWRTLAQAQVSVELPYAVAVRDDERQTTVFIHASPDAGPAVSLEVPLDPDTRLSRRRACLTVVEFLRVQGAAQTRAPEAPPPVLPVEAPPPAAPEAPPSEPDTEPVAATPPSAVTPPAAAPAHPPAPLPTHDQLGPAPRPMERPPWALGVATTLDVASRWSRPAGHLQFMWYFPLTEPVAVRLRAHWPLLGVDIASGTEHIRSWMFGAAVGLQLMLRDFPARWRPVIGLAVGNRIQLTEVSSGEPAQSRTGFTPSATLSIEVGARYVLNSRFQLLGELEGSRDWLFSTVNATDREIANASQMSFHASVGALFE